MMHDVPMEKLAFAEAEAQRNFTGRAATADQLRKEGHGLLLLMLALAGAALGTAVAVGPSLYLRTVALAVAVWLFGVCGYLAWASQRLNAFPAPGNTPENLLGNDMSAEDLRVAELGSLQRRIDAAFSLNEQRAKRINACVLAASATPLVIAAAAAVSAAVYR